MLSEIREVVAEVKRPNRTVLPLLRDYISANPEIWEELEIVGIKAEEKWIDLLVADRDDLRDGLRNQIDEIRREYWCGGSSPLERLLVDRIVVSWLMVLYFEAAFAVASEAGLLKQERFFSTQLSRAQRKHGGAVKSLVEVRKLLGGRD